LVFGLWSLQGRVLVRTTCVSGWDFRTTFRAPSENLQNNTSKT